MLLYFNMPLLKRQNALMITVKYVVIKKTLLQSGIVLFMPGIPLSVLNAQSALIHYWILQMMELVLTFDNLMTRQILFLLLAHWIMVRFKIFISQLCVFWPLALFAISSNNHR